MQLITIAIGLASFLRRYAVAVALIATFVIALIQVQISGVGPMPQQPPNGYTAYRTKVSLQWSRGTREEPITLQVAMDDPNFTAPILEREVKGTTHSMNKLEAGKTYYWRLTQGEEPSRTTSFEVSLFNANL